jgi:hypothetical protein
VKVRPFRFLEKQGRIDRLCAVLRESGFAHTARSELTLAFARDPSATPVEIVWELAWWDDGQTREDHRIVVREGRRVLAEIDVGDLLRTKLAQPLEDEIVSKVAQACAGASGRPLT